jgi:hypothetical protein
MAKIYLHEHQDFPELFRIHRGGNSNTGRASRERLLDHALALRLKKAGL